jgi:hypothetical protein
MRVQEAAMSLAQDGQGGEDDEHALEHFGEVLGLAMAIGVAGIGGAAADVQRQGCRAGRDHVDDALKRVRVEGDAARDPPGCETGRQHSHADADAVEAEVNRPDHADPVGW